MFLVGMKRARIFCQGHFGHFLGPGRVFFRGLGRFLKKGGGFSERGGDSFVFLIYQSNADCVNVAALPPPATHRQRSRYFLTVALLR